MHLPLFVFLQVFRVFHLPHQIHFVFFVLLKLSAVLLLVVVVVATIPSVNCFVVLLEVVERMAMELEFEQNYLRLDHSIDYKVDIYF
ncbi:hypothetical protein FWK35_00018654, partial [Aphis craccivora]